MILEKITAKKRDIQRKKGESVPPLEKYKTKEAIRIESLINEIGKNKELPKS